MKNIRSGWRYSSEDRRDSGKVWRIRNSNHKEETSGLHRHNVIREQGREERVAGWGGTDRTDYGPSSTAPSYRSVDAKGTEKKGDDGWGYTPVENNMSEDLTSAWEALATTNLSDWSKPPQIESVEHWDDTGAKETWDFVKSGRSPVNNPDLYLEKNIDWNSRIPLDLLACAENKNRNRRTSPRRSGSPVLLGLETLVDGWENNQAQGKVDAEIPKFIQSRDKLEQGGGSGSWGEAIQNGMPGQRRTKQQYCERVSGEKQSNLMRDDYKDRSRKRRGGNYISRPSLIGAGLWTSTINKSANDHFMNQPSCEHMRANPCITRPWQVHVSGRRGSQLSRADKDEFQKQPRFRTTHRPSHTFKRTRFYSAVKFAPSEQVRQRQFSEFLPGIVLDFDVASVFKSTINLQVGSLELRRGRREFLKEVYVTVVQRHPLARRQNFVRRKFHATKQMYVGFARVLETRSLRG